ncbi:MAG: HAD family hydrolase [Candidatus Binatia bacterium]
MNAPRAVLFDLGGTLAEGGADAPSADLAAALGLAGDQAHALATLVLRNVFLSAAALAERVRVDLGLASDPADAVTSFWNAQLAAPAELLGATTCVAAIRAVGAKVAVIANVTTPYAESYRRTCSAIVPLIDAWQLSCETGVAKPSAVAFHAVLETLGVEAAHALVVGDRLDEDIEPALALGMSALWLRRDATNTAGPVTVDPHAAPVPVPAFTIPEAASVAKNLSVVRRAALTWLWAGRGPSGLTAPLGA